MRKARDRKLSTASEVQILRLLDEGFHVNVRATRFAVGESTICRIKKRYGLARALPSSKVKVRRRYRTIGAIKRQWLFHLLDLRARVPTNLEKLASEFRTSEQAISEAIASRKRLVPVPNGHRNEPDHDG